MFKKSKQINIKNFVLYPSEYIEKQLKETWHHYVVFRIFFTVFNILIMIASFAIIISTATIFYNIRYGINEGFPVWYLLTSACLGSLTTLLGSLINFFSIKRNMEKYYKLHSQISSEIIYHKIVGKKTNKYDEYKLFLNVCLIMDIDAAMDERLKYEK